MAPQATAEVTMVPKMSLLHNEWRITGGQAVGRIYGDGRAQSIFNGPRSISVLQKCPQHPYRAIMV